MNKKELLMALEEMANDNESSSRAKLERYESEEEFLAAASRLARLKPGDIVCVDGEETGVFYHVDFAECTSRVVVLIWDKHEKRAKVCVCPIGCISIKRMADEEDAEEESC